MRLALDTTGDRLSLALGMTVRDVITESVSGARRHAGELLSAVDRLLARAGIGRPAITGLLLADGPGSFTGLRVAASFAKAMARAGGVDLWVAPSLMARVAHFGRAGEVIVAASDALRGELYCGAWLWQEASAEVILPLAARRPDVVREMLPAPDVLLGQIPAVAAETLRGWAARRVDGGAPAEAGWLFELAARPDGMVRIPDPEGWEPEYGRPAEAQARWEAQHQRPLPHPPGAGG